MATNKNNKVGNQKNQKLGVKPQLNRKQSNVKIVTDDIISYEKALREPFHDDAIGARVPDMYSYPTATYHSEGVITLKTDASGNCSVTLLPHPFLSAMDMTGNSVSSSTTGLFQYGTSDFFAAAPVANLKAALTNFRTVGSGYEIRNLMPQTSCTGNLIAAKVPISGQLPGPTALAAITDVRSVAQVVLGMDPAGSGGVSPWSSDILELPEADELTMQNLMSNALCVQSRPINADAFVFRATNNDAVIQAAKNLASGLTVDNSGAPVYIDALVSEVFNGWDAVLLTFLGCPASTTIAEVRYIHHFEGTPALPSGKGTVVPSMEVAKHVNINSFWSVLDRTLSSPSINLVAKYLGHVADEYYQKNKESIFKAMSNKIGLQL